MTVDFCDKLSHLKGYTTMYQWNWQDLTYHKNKNNDLTQYYGSLS